MRIRSFTFEPEAVSDFVEVPWTLRRGDPDWIPPLKAAVRARLHESNPFFKRGRARHFLALHDGAVVGRCSAFIDDRFIVDGAVAGMVGLFEVEPDFATASALLDEALGWLGAEGAAVAWGPIDFTIFNAYRFKTGGFDREPFLGEPNNPPYYPELFERYGFQALHGYGVWDLDESQVRALLRKVEEGVKRKGALAHGYVDRPLEFERFDEDLGAVYQVAMGAFEAHAGYWPLSAEEFAFWNQTPRSLLDTELVRLITSPVGEIAAVAYAYPDWAPLLRHMDGELNPEALVSALESMTPDRAVYHTAMVRDTHRGRGLVHLSWSRFIAASLARGYVRAVTGLVHRQGDWLSFMDGREPTRDYTLFSIDI